MRLTTRQTEFVETVWEYYRQNARHDMAWRQDPRPYNVLVSELMLQQTQVARVKVKFSEFMAKFPTIDVLARAPLADVLEVWSGLGYNRRAKFLHLAARAVVDEYEGTIPDSYDELMKLPGVGPNTAGAILAYAYNQPVAYIETNIRTVYLHHFFADSLDKVHDKEIIELLRETIDQESPREWYWALMDYGTYLKSQGLGRLAQSKHYKKQSPLAGSLREMRGRIIRHLTQGPTQDASLRMMTEADERYDRALKDLLDEHMIERNGDGWRLTGNTDAS